ncbi:MAG: exo-beta-N-acetylmuramidase NamZ domain-containing protein, partial [Cyclonatronaceae bacterium]
MPTSSTALTIFCLLTSTLSAFFTSGCTSEHEQKQPVQNTSTSTITVGADRLFTEYSHLIDGKRLALVTNHSGRLSNGTHLADALFEYPDADLVVLFGMEFNVRSNDYSLPRDAESDTDPVTGLPKHSLYGSTHKPTGEMLEGVEVIVFDIQEVGARFYEHINILGFVMEAAAENDIEIIVLDRPNPITGNHMDGFITDDEFLYGFGAFGKVPVIHGMTMAELALLYNGERMLRGGHQATLHVIEMQGWDRSMWYDETGIEWSRPSPNLPTLESILAYAGTCLFEGLNISEGRGTEKPFEYIGAPWIDHHAVAGLLNGLELPGVTFETIEFTPERMPFHGRD